MEEIAREAQEAQGGSSAADSFSERQQTAEGVLGWPAEEARAGGGPGGEPGGEGAVAAATGRRKEAVARARLLPGSGKIVVNGRTLEEYIPALGVRARVLEVFRVVPVRERFDIFVKVEGGGIGGQAGAVRHALARCLAGLDETYRASLKKAGLLTRDPRAKERRKYGLKKARKAPQYTKR